MEVDKQLKFKSHQRMQVEFISNNVDVMIHDCLSSVALALECDIAHRRSVAVLCMLYKFRCNPMHPLHGAVPGPMCQCGLHAVLRSHILIPMRLLAAEPRSTAGPLYPSQSPCGPNMLTLYSMVWEWLISRAGPIFFYWYKLLYPFVFFYSFSFSLLYVCRLVLWGWGIWTDTV